MATNTMIPLASQTITGSVATVDFNSIAQGYTDLVLIMNQVATAAAGDILMRMNSDSGTNYSVTLAYGNGTSVVSNRTSNATSMRLAYTNANLPLLRYNIMNYSNTTTNKTVVGRDDAASNVAEMSGGTWRSTSAITSLSIFCAGGNITGGTFSLYGIAAEGTSPAPKATGGAIYSDSTYYYHVFGASGSFVPNQTISADVLVVAGGGGAGYLSLGAAGGAGGLCFQSSRSITSGTYTVTVGGGGASAYSGGGRGTSGSNSVFDTITAVGGGGGGGNSLTGLSGGSGGAGGANGPSTTIAGGSGTQGNSGGATGYGNAGGSGFTNASSVGSTGGGGGAGGAGTNGTVPSNAVGGNGGVGLSGLTIAALDAMGAATGTGEFSGGNYYYAGGGAGGAGGAGAVAGSRGIGGGGASGASGLINTGGGCGANPTSATAGGSGIVIVRYAKA